MECRCSLHREGVKKKIHFFFFYNWLIHFVLVLLVLAVIVVRVVSLALLLQRTIRASRLADPVVYARIAYAFAATVVEPPVARGAHALAGRPTFVPGAALRHKRNGAIHCHHVWLQRTQLSVCGLQLIFHLVEFRCEQWHIKINWVREGKPSFVRIRFCRERLKERRHWIGEFLYVRFSTQRVGSDVRLRA